MSDRAYHGRRAVFITLLTGCVAVGIATCDDGAVDDAPTASHAASSLTPTAFFAAEIAPRLGASCGGCHAQAATGKLSPTPDHPESAWFFPVDPGTGQVTTRQHVEALYRTLIQPEVSAMPRVDLRTEPRFSMLVRKPLSESSGGVIHAGGDVFTSTRDPLYRALTRWIAMERGRRALPPTPLEGGEAGKLFKDEVLPVLVNNSCMTPSCHEINHTNLRFDPGVASDDPSEPLAARFDNATANRNRRTSLGLITKQLYLSGDVGQSRVLRKVLPLSKGGVLHKGGNHQFLEGEDDPDFQVLLKWATLERRELLSTVRIAGRAVSDAQMGAVRGVLFVRTPRSNHRRFLDPGAYQPGSDLWLLKLGPGETLETASGQPINLTARFHPGQDADVREPEVRYDGRGVLFAMRLGAEDGLDIYEFELDDQLELVEGSFRRLTFGPELAGGHRVHFTDPTYVPDPDDDNALSSGRNLERADIVYATNVDGEVAPIDEYGVLGEVDGGDAVEILDWERFERDESYVGRRIFVMRTGAEAPEARTIEAFDHRTSDGRPQPTRILLDRPLSEPVRPGDHYVIDRHPSAAPALRPAYSLHVMKHPPRGEEQRYFQAATRFTFSPNHELDTSVRTTGEVYFASLRSTGYNGAKPIFNAGRNRRHLDKAMSFPTHRGNRSRVRIIADFHEMPGGNDVFVGLAPDTVWEAGNLYLSDHQIGCAFEEGNPVDSATYLRQGPDEGQPGTGDASSHPRMVPPQSPLFPLVGPNGVTDHGVSPGGAFRDARPLPDGKLLVSYAAGPLDLADPQAEPDFDVHVLAPDPAFYGEPGGLGTPSTTLVRVSAASTPDASEVQAVPIMVRFKERIRAAKREAGDRYLRRPGQPAEDTRPGIFCERNFRVIDGFIDDNIPAGRHVDYGVDPVTGEPIPEVDRLAYVRLVAGSAWTREHFEGIDPERTRNGDPHSTWVSNGVHPAKYVMAEVPVDESGEACFPMVPDTPYVYQSLNSDRMTLRSLNRWFWVAPTERFGASIQRDESYQQCAACHGSMTGRAIDTYGAMDITKVGGCSASCHQPDGTPPPGAMPESSPQGHGLPPAERLAAGIPLVKRADMVAVNFSEHVRPILDRRCVACHDGGGGSPAPNLSARPTAYYDEGYENLLVLTDPAGGDYSSRRYVAEREAVAVKSYLVEKITGQELHAPQELSGDFPHPSRQLIAARGVEVEPLTAEERLTITRWIDLGATYRSPEAAAELSRKRAEAGTE